MIRDGWHFRALSERPKIVRAANSKCPYYACERNFKALGCASRSIAKTDPVFQSRLSLHEMISDDFACGARNFSTPIALRIAPIASRNRGAFSNLTARLRLAA
jgi:hypothetical protein